MRRTRISCAWRYDARPTRPVLTEGQFVTPRLLLFSAILLSANAAAQDVSGPARAIDGDTLSLAGISVRLFGIDAPEMAQTCQTPGGAWTCGADAAGKLASLVEGKPVRCEQPDIDRYGRTVAVCKVGGIDLSAAMAEGGFAIALPQFTAAYVANEERARRQKAGLWGSTFERPADYRAAHPLPQSKPSPFVAGPKPIRSGSRSFRNCKEAWAAGAAPLYRGQPGYRPEMDGDGDGIACEPFRRRR